MTWVATAIIGSAIIGGVVSNNASNKASKVAQTTADNNNALQREIYGQNTGNISPFIQRGNAAGTAQNALLGLGGDQTAARQGYNDYLANTDYGYQQDQARRGITGSFAARGLGQSGAALKALDDRRVNLNQSFFGQYMDRISGVNQTGLSGANALAGVGSNYAGAVGANNNSAASATGNAALSSAGNFNALLGQGANALGTYYGTGSSYGGSSPTAYQGGSVTGWASSLPNQTPLKGF